MEKSLNRELWQESSSFAQKRCCLLDLTNCCWQTSGSKTVMQHVHMRLLAGQELLSPKYSRSTKYPIRWVETFTILWITSKQIMIHHWCMMDVADAWLHTLNRIGWESESDSWDTAASANRRRSFSGIFRFLRHAAALEPRFSSWS